MSELIAVGVFAVTVTLGVGALLSGMARTAGPRAAVVVGLSALGMASVVAVADLIIIGVFT